MTHPRSHKRPLWLGALVGPLAAPFAAAPLASLLQPSIYVSFSDALIMFPIVAIVAVIYGYIGVAIAGLPVALLLRRFGRLSVATLCAISVPLGASLWLLSRLAATSPLQLRHAPMEAVVGGGVALAVAALFCIVCGITIRSSRTPQVASA